MIIEKDLITSAITEIKGQSEILRRTLALRRHLIYKDHGKKFLVESIRREFNEEAIKEMRLAPINLLKKIVNKRSSIYRRPPVRRAMDPNDQAIMDFYVTELRIDTIMQRCNRYFNLFSNTVLYVLPDGDGSFTINVIPPYLYSVIPSKRDRTKIEAYVFNAFTEERRAFTGDNPDAPTGRQGFQSSPGYETGTGKGKDQVASNEYPSTENRQYVFWSDEDHFTTDDEGELLSLTDLIDQGAADNDVEENQEENTDRKHELGRMPIINVAKDRDNEPWAIQGDDLVDLTMAIQSGWTDLLTIAKHQGFSVLTIVSEEAPQQMKVGINSAVWLKAVQGGVTPTMDYKSSSSNLGQYKEVLMELLGLLLSTNEMSPKAIGGVEGGRSATSGFQALIEMADTLEAREEDKPHMLAAEKDLWQVLKLYHNRYYDVVGDGCLCDEAKALGKFTDDFEPSISYSEVQPLESDDERTKNAILKLESGLSTRLRAMRTVYPGLDDEQLQAELDQIDAEKAASVQKMQSAMGGMMGNGAVKEPSLPKVPGQKANQEAPTTTQAGAPGADDPSGDSEPPSGEAAPGSNQKK